MKSTRLQLQRAAKNLGESVGDSLGSTPQLSPVASSKDIGRGTNQRYGRMEVDRICADPNQPRKVFDDDALKRLAMSIRDHGQLQPIRVRWSDELELWVIVSGERRWRASKIAGVKTIDCYFVDQCVTATIVSSEQLIENLIREDLKPLEEARSFQTLLDLNGWNGKQLANALNITPTKVSRSIALLRLPADVQQQVGSGQLSPRLAYEVSKFDTEKQQLEMARRMAGGELASAHMGQLAAKRKRRVKTKTKSMSLSFESEHGWTVQVSKPNSGNYHEVENALVTALNDVRHRIRNNVKLY